MVVHLTDDKGAFINLGVLGRPENDGTHDPHWLVDDLPGGSAVKGEATGTVLNRQQFFAPGRSLTYSSSKQSDGANVGATSRSLDPVKGDP